MKAEFSASTKATNGRTGWEKERAAFLALQNQPAEFSQYQLESADDPYLTAVGDIVHGVVQLGQAVDRIQSDAPIRDSTTVHYHMDRKIMEKEREKKIALGHKADDREQQGPTLSM